MNASPRWCLTAAGLAGLGVLTGCGVLLDRTVPGLVNWRYHAINGVEISVPQAAFIVPGQTTKAEVMDQFGYGGLNKPTWERPDGQAIAYTWTEVREGDKGGKFYRPYPFYRKGDVLYDLSDNWSEARAICIVFDASDRVVRFRFFAAKDDEALAVLFQAWAQTDAPRAGPGPAGTTKNQPGP